MASDVATGRSRRRRKGDNGTPTKKTTATVSHNNDNDNDNDNDADDSYYSDSDDEKGHDAKMDNSACSMGKFFLNPCLCCVAAVRHCFRRLWRLQALWCRSTKQQSFFEIKGQRKRGGRREWDTADIGLVAGIILSSLVSLYLLFPLLSTLRMHHSRVRPWTDADVNRVPLLIPSLDSSKHNPADIGGWMFRRRFFEPTSYYPIDVGQSDRGNLGFLGAFGKPREIQPNDDIFAELYWNNTVRRYDQKRMAKYDQPAEDIADQKARCRRVDWKMLYHPTCNEVHEIALSRDYHEETAGLGDDQIFDSFYIRYVFDG
jgi:hypothetical protein